MSANSRLQLVCPHCGSVHDITASSMLAKLQQIGMFRRGGEPALDLMTELFRSKVGSFACDQCGRAGMAIREVAGDDWNRIRPCSQCRRPIPLERLDLFPDADLCASCQEGADRGSGSAAEYCPKCGAIMTARTVYGRGVTRYSFVCPQCRR
jgi:predicted RNA-binding Zn-ribbon protein involved in translation (DUF1610 family)